MMSKNKRNLTEGSIFKNLLVLSIPIVFANILQTAYQLTDTYWVGKLGAVAVAAVSLSFPIIFLLISMGGGLAIAGSILVAQYIGRRDTRKADHVAAQTLLMMIAAVIPLSLLGYIFAEPVMVLMGAAPDVLPEAVAYMQISFIGLIFMYGYFVFQSLMRGVGEVKTPVYIVLSTVILNLFLDPLFIMGYGPIPAMGVAGAALATIITQAIAAVIGLFLLFSGKYGIHLKFSELLSDQKLMTSMFKLGLPASLEQSMRALGLTMMTFLVAGFGTTIVASYGIGMRMLSFVIIPALGLSMATSTLVAQNMGAGKIDRAEKTARMSALMGFGVLTVVGVVFFLSASIVAEIFVPGNTEVITESTTFIRVMALSFGFMGIQQALNGVYQGSGNTLTSMIFAMVSQWVLQFPLAYILSRHTTLGENGIWWAIPVSFVTMSLISLIWFHQGQWKKKRLIQPLENKVYEETVIEEG